MSPREYKAIRAQCGLTQQKLAELLELARETISKREHGHLPINKEAACAILWVRDWCLKLPPDHPHSPGF